MELQIKYPQFTGRRYGVAIYNPHGKTLVPAESFPIGIFLASTTEVIRNSLEKWLEHEKQPRDFKKLFDVSRKYRLAIRERGEIHERVRRLTELSRSNLEIALLHKIKAMEGSYNLLKVGGREAFDLNIYDRKEVDIHAGNVTVTGKVKSKSPGNKPQKTKFKDVAITGFLNQSRYKFTEINCAPCEDSFYAKIKQGYEGVNLLCTHSGSLLYFISQNPDIIKRFQHVIGLMGEDTRVFIPFHFDAPQEKPQGEQSSLDYLVIDVILDRYFNRSGLFEIGKKLTRIPVIYDSSLENLVLDERAGFEVLVNSYIFDTAKGINPAIKTLYALMRKSLEDQDYKMSGYCLEKKDSPYETIALIFRRDKDEVRLLFNKNFPPVAVFRKDRSTVVNVHRYIDPDTHLHPFSELFMPKRLLDDRSRKDTHYEVIIPSDFGIPPNLWPDYRLTIAKYFPGGIEGFERRINQREIRNRSNLLAIIGKAA